MVLDAVVQRPRHVSPGDDLQRYEIVGGGIVDLGIIGDDIHPLHPHTVRWHQLGEVRLYAGLAADLEPERRGAAQRLALERHLGGNNLVENGDVIGEEELQRIVVDLEYLLDLSGSDQFHLVSLSVRSNREGGLIICGRSRPSDTIFLCWPTRIKPCRRL